MNRKLKAIIGGIAVLAISPIAALALDALVFVQFVDREERRAFLDNGDWIILPEDFDLATIAAGSRIMVTYDNAGEGPYQATAVTIVGEEIADIRNNELDDGPVAAE